MTEFDDPDPGFFTGGAISHQETAPENNNYTNSITGLSSTSTDDLYIQLKSQEHKWKILVEKEAPLEDICEARERVQEIQKIIKHFSY